MLSVGSRLLCQNPHERPLVLPVELKGGSGAGQPLLLRRTEQANSGYTAVGEY